MTYTVNTNAHTSGVIKAFTFGAAAAAPSSWLGILASYRTIGARQNTAVVPHGSPRPQVMGIGDNYSFGQALEETIPVTVTKYGIGMRFTEEDRDDEQIPVAVDQIADMGKWSVEFPNFRIGQAYQAAVPGGTIVGSDGVTIFNTAHPARGALSATQSNVLTGTGTTVAACVTDIYEAVSDIRSFRDYSDVVMRRAPSSILIYGPHALSRVLHEAVTSMIPHPQATNNTAIRMLSDMTFTVVIDPDLDSLSTVDYFVIDVSNPARLPIAYHDRDPWRLRSKFNDDNDSFEWRLRARFGESGWDWSAGVYVNN